MSFNLANRVNNLNRTTKLLLDSISEYAPLNSPTFTGGRYRHNPGHGRSR